MAGSISLSLSQQFDGLGKPLTGGLLYFFAASTTNPQSAYQDVALTIPWPNPITLDSAGRVPAFYLADGQIKIRLTDKFGVLQVAADNILVIGPSSGSGSPPSVDPTTLIQTGWIQPIYGTGPVTGFVRANGRTMGNASSGAAERANPDTQALWIFLYGQDANLVVAPAGRTGNALNDYNANKTIILPDWRGRALAALDDMGNAAAGRLTSTYFGTAATVLGAAGGAESKILTLAQLPTGITAANAAQAIAVSTTNNIVAHALDYGAANASIAGAFAYNTSYAAASQPSTGNNAISVISNNTGGLAHAIASPMMLVTVYLKL